MDYEWSSYVGDISRPNLEQLETLLGNLRPFLNSGASMYFSGENNTQKTSVATCFMKKVVASKFSAAYVTMKGLYDLISDFHPTEEDQNRIYVAQTCRLLVVDEAFDPRKLHIPEKSTFQESILDNFFRTRFNNLRGCLFVSNIARSDISSSFGTGLIELLNRGCLDFFWKDKIPYKLMTDSILKFIAKGAPRE